MQLPEPINNLIEGFMRLPGIGQKTAQRLAFFVLDMNEEYVMDLAKALVRAKRDLKTCSVCECITDEPKCLVCSNPNRDDSIICVVEETKDLIAMERTGEYKGLYHVLNGVISPIEGVGPDDLNIASLLKRLGDDKVKEVILATNANIEGESTSSYIRRLVQSFGLRITRLAHGLPVGGDLDYADEVTISRALEGRREI